MIRKYQLYGQKELIVGKNHKNEDDFNDTNMLKEKRH